jgi:Flp pilus assembly protein TadG
LVEFVLVFPILIILVFGVIDFALGVRSYVSLTNATREGARYGAVGNPLGSAVTTCAGSGNTNVVGRVCTVSEGLNKDQMTVTPSCDPDCEPGNSIHVEATYTYDFVTPLGDMMSFFSGGSVPSSLDMESSVDMRLE